MEFGKVALLEVAGLHQRAGQRVAHGQRGGGTARGSQVEGAGLLLHLYVYMVSGVLCQQRLRIAGHAYERNLLFLQRGHKAQQLVGLAAVAYGKHNVVLGNCAQVAMEQVERIGIEGRCARTAQRGGNLGADMAALAHSGQDHLALAREYQFHHCVKVLIYLRNQAQHGLCLVLQTLNGNFSILAHNKVLMTLFKSSRRSILGPSLSAWSGSGCTSKK